MIDLTAPSLAGYTAFLYNVVGIPTSALPSNSPYIQFSYQVALDIVNPTLQVAPSSSPSYPSIYALAVYNLGADRLVNWAPDETPVVVYPPGDAAGLGFFQYTRKTMNLNSFVGGVIQSTSDESTSQSMVVPEQMKNLTFQDLQSLKTPWGRTYLGFAQAVGTNWGIS